MEEGIQQETGEECVHTVDVSCVAVNWNSQKLVNDVQAILRRRQM